MFNYVQFEMFGSKLVWRLHLHLVWRLDLHYFLGFLIFSLRASFSGLDLFQGLVHSIEEMARCELGTSTVVTLSSARLIMVRNLL